MSYTINEIRNKVYLIESDIQYEIASMFMRPQEYYESPFENIQGKHFSVEEYIDQYVKETGGFTYYTDWCGFNIPSENIKTFFQLFKYDLTAKEILLDQLIRIINPRMDGAFYVIGCSKDEKQTIKHELAHAYWYLYPEYKNEMLSYISWFSQYQSAVNSMITTGGYNQIVMKDEFQAYVATSSRDDLIKFFGWNSKVKIPSAIKKYFKEFDKKHK
jgi:hypothetical protein